MHLALCHAHASSITAATTNARDTLWAQGSPHLPVEQHLLEVKRGALAVCGVVIVPAPGCNMSPVVHLVLPVTPAYTSNRMVGHPGCVESQTKVHVFSPIPDDQICMC